MLDEPEKFTYVSSLLSSEEKEQLQRVLLRNIDMFAWNPSDMTGIDSMLASHKLNVNPSAKPVRQKVRRFQSNCHQIIYTEVDNLLRASFIREVKYLNDLLMWWWSQRRAVSGEYVWTTWTSTKHVQKIASPYHK